MAPRVVSGAIASVRRAVQPAVDRIRARLLQRELLNGLARNTTGYVFTGEDVRLFVRERFGRALRPMIERIEGDSLLKVTIDGRSIFWPASLKCDDLPWLYREVFDPFKDNPSSYDHLALGYERRRWILDAGAAEGYFSVFALERSAARILSVEPLPALQDALARTLALHARGRQVLVVPAALGDKPGSAFLQVDAEHVSDSKIVDRTRADEDGAVAVTTIDQLVSQHGLAADGVIKMDVEGYEMAALRGAERTLREHRPALAIAVYHQLENARQCAEIVHNANPGYRIELRGYYGWFDPPRPYMLFAT